MDTATAPPNTTTTHQATPGWYPALIIWRVITLVGIAGVLAAAFVRRGIVLDGPIRWTFLLAMVGATIGAGIALNGTIRRRHVGRLAGFIIDFLIAVVFGFITLNRMEMFTGLDAVGEAFNGSAAWILVIVLGWLISGFANRGATTNHTLLLVARWIMIGGAAVLVLTMGLIPGVVEFLRRIVQPENIGYAIVAIAGGAFARILWSDGATDVFGTTQTQAETMDGLFFVAPNVLGFLAFFAGPLIVSIFISFTDWDGLTDATFVGLDNYAELFGDSLFLRSLRNILVLGLVAIPLSVIPALLLAALLNSKLPGMKTFRAIYFLPSIAGVVGVTLIWKQLYDSTVGYLNYAILRSTEWFNSVFGTMVEAPQPQWISDATIALFATAIVIIWQVIGFNTILFLAGMQGIDRTLYEAADIDGAGAWQKFRKITVPSLRPTTVFVVATTTILVLQSFNEQFILQSPGNPAGPGNSTLTPVVYLYQNAFQQFQIGYGSAVAWALFVLIFGLTLLYFRTSGDEGVLSA